jgi:hypothetical protein
MDFLTVNLTQAATHGSFWGQQLFIAIVSLLSIRLDYISEEAATLD